MSISEAHGSGPHAVFAHARVVELVEGAAADADAVVRPLHSAVVRVGRERITAADGDYEWTWLVPELTEVVHGDEGAWTIFTVPGVAGFGVEVATADRAEFRRVIDALPGVRPVGQAPPRPTPPPLLDPVDAVLDLTDEPAPGPSVFAVPPLLPPPPPPVVTPDPPAPEVLDVPTGPVTAFTPDEPADAVATTPGTALKGLEARDISAWFGDHQVLDRVSLEMPPGQVTALIGPSGCGKSTFLRILNRMHEMIPGAAMAGEVLLDGQDVYDADRKLTEARKQIGMVFQKPNPFPAMSIYENVLASFRLTGRKASEGVKDEVVQSCLAKAGLWDEVKDRLRQPGGGLSGGQQQRLCIARALAIRPDVLLMDEPCSALDPTSTRRIEETIHELRTEVTVVIVTHNMQQAARVSNQCAFFLAAHGTPGVIVEHGETEAMFGSPRDQRTDDYVNGRFG